MSSAVEAAEAESRGGPGAFLLALRTRGFRDNAFLAAVEQAHRPDFLPPTLAEFAYRDVALPIACGQEATSPFVVAAVLQHLDLASGHRVLEVGTGTGWQSAVLAGLCDAVVTVERFASLADEADRRLIRHGFDRVVVAHGDGTEGLAEAAPFDRIVVNGAVEALPPALGNQLAEGGVLVAPVTLASGQMLRRWTRRGRLLRSEDCGSSAFPMLRLGAASAL